MKTTTIITILLAVTLLTACGTSKVKNANDITTAENTVKTTVAKVIDVNENDTTVKTVEPTAAPLTEEYKEITTIKSTDAPKVNKPTEKNTASITKSFAVTRDEAKAIALKHAGLNEAELDRYNIELDTERNTTVYEIDFNANNIEYDYIIDVETGKILHNEKEKDRVVTTTNNKTKNTTSNPSAPALNITKEEAKATVLNNAKVKENEVKGFKIELDKERNELIYEIEFNAGKYEYEYEVSAESGKILKNKKEFRD